MNKNRNNLLPNLRTAIIALLLVIMGFTSNVLDAQAVNKQLYLSDPSQALDREDPVETSDGTTATSESLGAIGGGAAGSFTTPGDISLQWGGEDALTSDLAVYESGGVETLHTVFLGKQTGANKKNIYYSTKTGAGSWSTPIPISNDGWNQDAILFPSIAVDDSGVAHVAYVHRQNETDPKDEKLNIYYVTVTSGTPSAPVRISNDNFGNDALTPEIAIDANGDAHVAYVSKSSSDEKLNIYYVNNIGGSWSTPVRVSDDGFGQDVKLNPAIAVDSNGAAHVAYTHKNGTVDAKINIYYATNASGSWSAPERLSNDLANQDAKENPSIVIDDNNIPHVVYAHKDDSNVDAKINIYYTEKTTGSWSTPIDLSNDVDGEDSTNPTIAISSTGIVRVAFSNNGDNIYYTENSDTGGAWTSLVDINTSPTTSSDGQYPAVAITKQNVHVVYQDKHNTLSGKIDVWHTSAPLGNWPTSTTFTQTPVLCSDLVLPAGETITVTLHTDVLEGTMPASPTDIEMALVDSLGNPIITIPTATFAATTGTRGTLVWSDILLAETTIAAGSSIVMNLSTEIDTATFVIEYDSSDYPSHIAFETSTFINIDALDVYDATYQGGNIITKAVQSDVVYVRVVVSDPFGPDDITSADIEFTPTISGTPILVEKGTEGCTKTYEYSWATPAADQVFDIQVTAHEGYEGAVTAIDNTDFEVCTNCPPSAVDDYITIDQGESVKIAVLDNDSDPNENIDLGSMTITSAPDNGGTALPQADGTIIYFPNGSFLGVEQFTYQVCDLSEDPPGTPAPKCSTATVFVTVEDNFVDVCSEANRGHTYYLPFPAADLYDAFPDAISCPTNLGTNLRTVIAIRAPYPGTVIVYDHWEDGFESDPQNPIELTTETWGDGDIFNGVAPGYPTDILPAGASIVVDTIFNYSTRTDSPIEFDGRDKLVTSSDISLSKISGDTNAFTVQSAKTDVYDTNRFGTSFVVPFGENLGGEFQYTALFIRAKTDGTSVTVDVNADGVLDGDDVIDHILNEGEVLFIEGNPASVNQDNDVRAGASVTATEPVGLDVLFGGLDCYGTRNINILPGAFYSNVYYAPVPTTDSSDPNAVYVYNSTGLTMDIDVYDNTHLVTPLTTLNVAAGTTEKYQLPQSTTSGYKFVNAAGDSFTIIEVMDSPTATNSGATFDWSISLIAQNRLSDFASIAWAPGSDDFSTNTGPLWVTMSEPTDGLTSTLYVKYDGDVVSAVPPVSPCDLAYDYSVTLGELDMHQVLDSSDNDQSGVALFTCDGTVFAGVYGEDSATASTGGPSLDVGTLMQPMCRDNNIFAVDDFEVTPPDTPVLIGVLDNDFGFLATVDPASIITLGYLQPEDGTITVNTDGTILYTPDNGYLGEDTFEYQVCSIEDPDLCDVALVTVLITDCNANVNNALINGFVYLELEPDNGAYDAENFLGYRSVDLYSDANGNGIIDGTDAVIQSTVSSAGGNYTFAVTSTGNYIAKVNVSDGEYIAALLDEQPASITALNTCVSDLYLGLRPVLTAIDDNSAGGVDQLQVISILDNDLGVPDPTTVTTTGLLQPTNGTVTINEDGTVTYTPNPGYIGTDVFEYQVCSLEDPGLCDIAEVTVDVSCDFSPGENNIFGTVFYDEDRGADFDAGEARAGGVTVYLYEDMDNDGAPDGAAIQTTTTDVNGNYDFTLNLVYETSGNYSGAVSSSADDSSEKENGDSKGIDQDKLEIKDDDRIGVRFTGVDIPSNATITSAFLYFTAESGTDKDMSAIVRGQDDTANPEAFTEDDNDIQGRSQTAASQTWTFSEWEEDHEYQSPDISNVITEIKNNVSGLDDDEIVLIVQGSGDEERKAKSWDTDDTSVGAPRLVVNYTIPGDDPYYYLTEIVVPTGAERTTAQYQATYPDFALDGVGSCGNDFGLYINTTDAENDINQTPVDTPVGGNVLTNDTDPEGETQTVNTTPVSGPGNGTVTLNADGTYTYNPNTGFTGTDTFVYEVCDDGIPQACDQATVTIEVIPDPDPGSNNPPIAQDDTNTVEQGVTVTSVILSNDSDPDGDSLTVTSASGLNANGSAVVLTATPQDVYDANHVLAGQASIDGSGNVIFTAAASFTGNVPVNYTISDGHGGTDSAVLTISVDESDTTDNDTYGNDDASTGMQGDPQTGNVLDNDTDPNVGDTQTVTDATDSNGNPITPGTSVTLPSGGTLVINPDGSYTYAPAPDFVGTEVVVYTVCDDVNPPACDTATLYLTTLEDANTTLAENDINQTPMDTPVDGNVLTNDTDPEGHTQSVQSVLADTDGDGVVDDVLPLGTATDVYDGATLAGSMILNADGSYTFTPSASYASTVPLEYTVLDSEGATDTATLKIEVIPTPDPGANNPPIARDDTNTVEQGATVTSVILSNDSDTDGDALTVTSATGLDASGNSTVVLTATPQDVYDASGVLAGQASLVGGEVVFTAAATFTGDVPIDYVISDGNGGTDSAVLTITVEASDATDNDTYGNDDANMGLQGDPQTGNVLTNDNDPEGDTQTVTGATNSAGAPLTVDGTTSNNLPSGGALVINLDGTYTYAPDPDFVGTEIIEYTVCDDGVPQACDTATLYLTTLEDTNTTLAENDINQTPQDVPVNGDVLTNDTDPEGHTQSVQSATGLDASGAPLTIPTDGTPTDVYDASGVLAGSVTISSTGTYTFTPATGYTGTVPLEYTVLDSEGATDTATLTIEVLPVPVDGNNPPIAQDDTNTVEQGATVTSVILSNDSDTDGDALTVTSATGLDASGNSTVVLTATPQDVYDASGVLAGQASLVGGEVVFTAAATFTGDVPIDYVISDGNGGTDSAVLTITVEASDATDNDTYGNDDANTGLQGDPQTGNILANDNDPEGDDQDVSSIDTDGDGIPDTTPVAGTPITITQGGITIGALTLDPETGEYLWAPEPDFVGTAVIPYTATDGVATDDATLYLTTLAGIVPDVTPVIVANPNVMTGPTDYDITVRIRELNNVDTVGLITVFIPKDPRWVLHEPYDPGATTVGGVTVDNDDWAYEDNGTQHVFTTTVTIPAGDASTFGIKATWDAGQTKGEYTITSQIVAGSGNENRIDNNVDAEVLGYFIN